MDAQRLRYKIDGSVREDSIKHKDQQPWYVIEKTCSCDVWFRVVKEMERPVYDAIFGSIEIPVQNKIKIK